MLCAVLSCAVFALLAIYCLQIVIVIVIRPVAIIPYLDGQGTVQYSTAEVLARLVDVLCCVAQTVPPAEVYSCYLAGTFSKLLGSLLCRGVFEKCAGFRGSGLWAGRRGKTQNHHVNKIIKPMPAYLVHVLVRQKRQ